MARLINQQEMKDLVDEALLRIEPGWSVFGQYGYRIILAHEINIYNIHVQGTQSGFEIYTRFTETSGVTRSYNLPYAKVKYTTSSQPLAQAIQFSLIGAMDEIVEQEMARRTAPSITQTISEIKNGRDEFISDNYRSYEIRIMSRDHERGGRHDGKSATFSSREHWEEPLIIISAAVGVDTAKKISDIIYEDFIERQSEPA